MKDKNGKERTRFEVWLDKYNHIMELWRTLFSFLGVVLQVVILLKVFGII